MVTYMYQTLQPPVVSDGSLLLISVLCNVYVNLIGHVTHTHGSLMSKY
jgi:hypothetical protein